MALDIRPIFTLPTPSPDQVGGVGGIAAAMDTGAKTASDYLRDALEHQMLQSKLAQQKLSQGIDEQYGMPQAAAKLQETQLGNEKLKALLPTAAELQKAQILGSQARSREINYKLNNPMLELMNSDQKSALANALLKSGYGVNPSLITGNSTPQQQPTSPQSVAKLGGDHITSTSNFPASSHDLNAYLRDAMIAGYGTANSEKEARAIGHIKQSLTDNDEAILYGNSSSPAQYAQWRMQGNSGSPLDYIKSFGGNPNSTKYELTPAEKAKLDDQYVDGKTAGYLSDRGNLYGRSTVSRGLGNVPMAAVAAAIKGNADQASDYLTSRFFKNGVPYTELDSLQARMTRPSIEDTKNVLQSKLGDLPKSLLDKETIQLTADKLSRELKMLMNYRNKVYSDTFANAKRGEPLDVNKRADYVMPMWRLQPNLRSITTDKGREYFIRHGDGKVFRVPANLVDAELNNFPNSSVLRNN